MHSSQASRSPLRSRCDCSRCRVRVCCASDHWLCCRCCRDLLLCFWLWWVDSSGRGCLWLLSWRYLFPGSRRWGLLGGCCGWRCSLQESRAVSAAVAMHQAACYCVVNELWLLRYSYMLHRKKARWTLCTCTHKRHHYTYIHIHVNAYMQMLLGRGTVSSPREHSRLVPQARQVQHWRPALQAVEGSPRGGQSVGAG